MIAIPPLPVPIALLVVSQINRRLRAAFVMRAAVIATQTQLRLVQIVQPANTQLTSLHRAPTAWLDMRMQTATQRQSAWHALRASTLQQGQLLALIVYLARTMTIRTHQLRVKLALLGITLGRV